MTQQHAYAETAVGPDLPIIEAHHHMWPAGRYDREDLKRDMSQGHDIVKTVFIDCSASYRADGPEHLKPVGETEWAVSQQGPDGICAAIIGHVNMYLPAAQAAEALDAHLEAGKGSFKGVRHNVAWDRHPDTNNALRGAPEFALLDPVFQAATAEVAKRGLIFETWLYFNQLGDMKKLAQAQPDLKIVLNHLGGPAVNGPYAKDRPGMLKEWRRQMAGLAQAPNVFLKVGGIGYKSFVEPHILNGPKTSEVLAEYWKPEITFAVETFGPERSMFETNYPEDRHLTDFVVLWNTYKRIAADFSADERAWVFEKAASSVYGI
jgi:predicted TIM-barrel fold metal-dependent hydrolase